LLLFLHNEGDLASQIINQTNIYLFLLVESISLFSSIKIK